MVKSDFLIIEYPWDEGQSHFHVCRETLSGLQYIARVATLEDAVKYIKDLEDLYYDEEIVSGWGMGV